MITFALIFHLNPMKRLFFTIISVFLVTVAVAQQTTFYNDLSGLSSNRVGAVVQDNRGLIWFASWNGLNVYDGYNFYRIKNKPANGNYLQNDRIRNMMLSPEGNLWCYAENDVVEFNLKTYTFRPIPQSKREMVRRKLSVPWTKLIDRQDNIWTGDSLGIYKESIVHHPAIPLQETIGCNTRALLVDDNDVIWVGMKDSQSISFFNSEGKFLNKISVGTQPYSLYQPDGEHVFLGGKPAKFMRILPVSSAKGVTFSDVKVISNDAVYDMQTDARGRLWIASFNGGILCCPNPEAKNPVITHLVSNIHARTVLVTPKGNILVGTSKGLFIAHINEKDYTKTHFKAIVRNGKDPKGLSNSIIMDIVQDSKGMIYIATESSGIEMISEESLFSSKPEFTHFTDDNSSVSSDFCHSLTLLGDSTLMVVGLNNVMIFNPKQDETTNFNHVFWADNCHFAEGQPARLHNGNFIFATEEGAYIVKPRSMFRRGYVPPLIITSVNINGNEADHLMPQSDTIYLDANNRTLTIKYAALDLGNNQHIEYRTRLDDTHWTKASLDREISFFDLEPGTHQLMIQSTDRYGRWADNITTITIIAEAHWYETLWAKILFWVLSIGFIGAMIHLQFFIRNLKKQRAEALEKYMALIDETAKNSNILTNSLYNADGTTSAPEPSFKTEDQWFMDRVRTYVEENMDNSDANIDDMAAAAATSRSTLNRRLNSIIGITAAQLLIDARMRHAVHLITTERNNNNPVNVTDIAYKCGYTDPKYFSRCFKQKYGSAPSEYLPH